MLFWQVLSPLNSFLVSYQTRCWERSLGSEDQVLVNPDAVAKVVQGRPYQETLYRAKSTLPLPAW